jgi:hypothetical protein
LPNFLAAHDFLSFGTRQAWAEASLSRVRLRDHALGRSEKEIIMGAVSTIWAPLHRALGRWSNSSNLGFPPNAAPSLDFLGSGIQDHRMAYNSRGSSATQPGIVGWYGSFPLVANYVPSAIATANIAALAHVGSGTAMTLVSSSGSGITVLTTAAPAFFMPTGLSLAAGVVIDGLPSLAVFGSGGNFQTGFYNRSTYVGRGVSISGVSGGAGGTFTVAGYDIYGYPMTQLVTVAAGANTVNTLKTFKAIASVTPNFTDAHNYSVGTADLFGFGILASFFGDTRIVWNNAEITASTGFTAADTTSPATNATGDVRGTYAVQSASDGTKRLMMQVTPTLGSIASNPTTGLFGQPQV